MEARIPQLRSLRQRVESKITDQLQRNAARKIVSGVRSWQLNWEKAARRWVWELLQNAIDTAERCGKRLCVKFDLRQDTLIYEHDGGPFLDEEIGALLLAGSAKPFDKSPYVGRFGTGFLVTHAISPYVVFSGQAEGCPGGFKVVLDRSGSDDDIHSNIKSCYEALEQSEAETGLGTRFEYTSLEAHSLGVARRGLALLDALVPYVFAFNDRLQTVEVIRDQAKTRWERGKEKTATEGELNIRQIPLSKSTDSTDEDSKYVVHLTSPSESGLAAAVVLSSGSAAEFIELEKDHPKVYRNIPLLGSEEAGIPIAIHCPFDIDEERSAAFLFSGGSIEEPPDDDDPRAQNQKLAVETLSGLADFLAYLSRLDACGAHKAVRLEPAPSPSGDSAWNSALKALGNCLLSLPIVKSATDSSAHVNPSSVVFLNPIVSGDLSHIKIEGEKLWSLVSDFDISLPSKETSVDWGKAVSGWQMLGVDVPEVWSLEDVLGHARKASSMQDLAESIGADETDALAWLRAALDLLAPHASELPTGMLDGLLPDQNGYLKKPNQLAVDLGVDECLKEIAEGAGISLRSRLLEKQLSDTTHSKETQHLISQYVTEEMDSNAAVKQLVDEMRNRLLDMDKASPGTLAEGTDPIVHHSAKLLTWLATHRPHFDASVRDLPLVTASGDLIVSPGGPNCHLPLEAWPDRARPFIGVFPESSRLASFYVTAADESYEAMKAALVDWEVCFCNLVVIEESLELKGSLVQKLLRDRDQSVDARSSYSCQRCSRIPLLNEVIGRIGTDCERATHFLKFLINYVIREDSRWRDTGEAANRGGELPIRPSEWLGRVLRDNWVPNPGATEGTADRIPATQESLRNLVPWAEINSDAISLEFLGLTTLRCGFSPTQQGTRNRKFACAMILPSSPKLRERSD